MMRSLSPGAAATVVLLTVVSEVSGGQDTAVRTWRHVPAAYSPVVRTSIPHRSPVFHRVIDEAIKAMDLPPLSAVNLPAGALELRLWAGFGTIAPHTLLRIVRIGVDVSGEDVLWWTGSSNDTVTTSSALFRSYATAPRSSGCNSSPIQPWYGNDVAVACKWAFGRERTWPAVLARLDSLRVRTLPDPSMLQPPEHMGDDGITLLVEILEGDDYRTYVYWEPELQPWPEARDAYAILLVARNLESVRK